MIRRGGGDVCETAGVCVRACFGAVAADFKTAALHTAARKAKGRVTYAGGASRLQRARRPSSHAPRPERRAAY